MPRRLREYLLWASLIAPLVALVTASEPIAQDPGYHGFVDGRTFLGVPNALNVLSNLPFLWVGIAGLMQVARSGGATLAWRTHFAGTALVCLGSAWYHWHPSSTALVWDRIPMTIAFMGLFVALVCEHLKRQPEGVLLAVAVSLGIGSVLWWAYTDDLRPYVWIQFGPLLAIPVLMSLFPPRYTHRLYLLLGLGFYAAAKLAEHWDQAIFDLTGHLLSGHTLKHLLAAGAPWCVLRMLALRAPVPAPPARTPVAASASH